MVQIPDSDAVPGKSLEKGERTRSILASADLNELWDMSAFLVLNFLFVREGKE